VLIISSPEFENHIPPPGHPERPERAHAFDTALGRWVQNGGRVIAPRPATRLELERAHTAAHVEAIERTAGKAVMLDPDTFTSADSADIAKLAAGAAVQAVELAVAGQGPTCALVRPPGHHAERHRPMGFCLYNNVAVAAAAARSAGIERVAIVDIDVHHGNGTQQIFYGDPAILYISTHQFPFYPGTGAADETGSGPGAGFTVNVPLEAGANDGDYALVHSTIVLPILDHFRPQVTIVSAGYDAHERDPLASMRMTAAGYGHIVKGLHATAARHGALACVTEGGYELTALTASLEATFAALEEKPLDAPNLAPTARGERAVAAVRAAQKAFSPRL
jgi:acetoin utilization deacetylase AcuC-like enzyme